VTRGSNDGASVVARSATLQPSRRSCRRRRPRRGGGICLLATRRSETLESRKPISGRRPFGDRSGYDAFLTSSQPLIPPWSERLTCRQAALRGTVSPVSPARRRVGLFRSSTKILTSRAGGGSPRSRRLLRPTSRPPAPTSPQRRYCEQGLRSSGGRPAMRIETQPQLDNQSPMTRDTVFISHATPHDNDFVRWLGTRCGVFLKIRRGQLDRPP
jgi:hypothetical protein